MRWRDQFGSEGGQFGGPSTVVTTEDGTTVVVPGGSFEDGQVIILERDPKPAALINLIDLPLVIRDLVFLGEVEDTHPMSGLANGGLYAILLYLAVVLIALGTLLFRYNEVER